MKKLMLSLVAVASLATVGSTFAQPYGPGPMSGQGPGAERPVDRPWDRPVERTDVRFARDIDQRITDLGFRIDQGQRQGQLRGREARGLRDQLQQVRWMEQRARNQDRGRLNGWQRDQINARLDRIAGQLRFERHDGPARY